MCCRLMAADCIRLCAAASWRQIEIKKTKRIIIRCCPYPAQVLPLPCPGAAPTLPRCCLNYLIVSYLLRCVWSYYVASFMSMISSSQYTFVRCHFKDSATTLLQHCFWGSRAFPQKSEITPGCLLRGLDRAPCRLN